MSILRVLVQIICAPSILISIIVLSKFRFSRRKTILLTALMTTLLVAIDFFAVFFGDHLAKANSFIDLLYRVSNILVAVVFAAILTRQQTEQLLFIVLSVCVGTYIVDTIALTIRALFGLYPLELAFELLLYPVIIFAFVKIRRSFIKVIEYMKGSLWSLCLAPAFLLMCFFLQISVPRRLVDTPANIPVALLLCCVAVTVYILFYYLFQAMYAKGTLEHNAMAMKLSVSSLEQSNSIAAQNEKRICLFKHDLRHITQMMSGCLDNGDTASARELLLLMENNIAVWGTPATQLFTGYKLLDATLCHYIDLAKESGINITVSMCQMEKGVTDMTELTVVLANALENAVSACEKLRDGEPRVIRLDGHRRGKQYFLEIANTCDGEVSFNPVTGTPISDKEGHGFGSQSIAYFAEKNHAVLQYRLEGRWFHLRLLMKK